MTEAQKLMIGMRKQQIYVGQGCRTGSQEAWGDWIRNRCRNLSGAGAGFKHFRRLEPDSFSPISLLLIRLDA